MTLHIWYTFLAGNLFNDTARINVRASADRYAELVEKAILTAYPKAIIEIEIQHGVEGGNGSEVNVADEDENDDLVRFETERNVTLNVEDITARVFNEGNWYILTEENLNT